MAGTNSKAELVTGGPVIILVEPQLGENIGTAARAMANFGLSRMRIVNPRDGWPNDRARGAAAKADHVIDAVEVFDNLQDAIADLNHVYATTARSREIFVPVNEPEAAMRKIHGHDDAEQSCGILFGRERWGLKNEEVVLADEIITFPVNPAFASLNIAQAVLLISYEWMRSINDTSAPVFSEPENPPATKKDMAGLFQHLEGALDEANFFRPPEKREHMIGTLRALLQKGKYSLREVSILRGVIGVLQGRETRNTKRRQAMVAKQQSEDVNLTENREK
ncbi:MAG: RNA methyltransferase [Hyphomicrobiales bacterium]|nr:RNA methyltransferase [Hyphomicrobiales bacterium]PCJ83478.1 MAG: RNA methyltransferase [Hyphomicrobiales bacterium]